MPDYENPYGRRCNCGCDQPKSLPDECPIYVFDEGVTIEETTDKLGRVICIVKPTEQTAIDPDLLNGAVQAMDGTQLSELRSTLFADFIPIVGNDGVTVLHYAPQTI